MDEVSYCWLHEKWTSDEDFLKVISRKFWIGVSAHAAKYAHEIKSLSGSNENWKCVLNEAPVMLSSAQQGTGFYLFRCALLFFFSAFSWMIEEGDYNLVWLKASGGTWVQVKKEKQWFGCGVWILGDIFGLFFQKWLVAVAVVTKNLARDLVSLQKFSWGAFVAFQWLIKTLGSQTFLENLHEQFLQQGRAVGKILVDYLVLCLVATVCLFISLVTLTMLLTATLNIWCD